MIPGRGGAGWVRWGGAVGAAGRGLGPLEGAVGAARIWAFARGGALGAVGAVGMAG